MGRVVTGEAIVAGIALEFAELLRTLAIEELFELELDEESFSSTSSGFDRSYSHSSVRDVKKTRWDGEAYPEPVNSEKNQN